MITSLTPAQEAMIPVYRDKWLKKVFINGPKSIDLNKMIEANNWLYEFSGLKKPITLIARSPYEAQLMANIVKRDQVWDQVQGQVGDQVGQEVRRQVEDEVEDQVRDQVRDQVNQVWDQVSQVGDQVRDQVGDQVNQVWDQVGQVGDQVRDQVGDQVSQVGDQVNQVGDQVGDQVRDQVRNEKYYNFSWYGNYTDFGWLSYYDFFSSIDELKIDWSKLKKMIEYIDTGVFMSIQLEGVCIVCPSPDTIVRNGNNELHCEDGPAVVFGDGYSLFALDGIRFDRPGNVDLYWKIVRKELTLPEILQIEDIDQRAIALKYCNAEKIISDLGDNAVLVDTGEKKATYLEHNSVEFIDGVAQINFAVEKPAEVNKTLTYSLYKVTIPGVFDEPEYMLVYPHASIDGLSYWKGVDPEIAKQGSIAAIAHSHNMTVDEYLSATSQS